MKVGILTYHCVPNFGAQLQTLSTVGFLKRHGFEPVVLHYYPQDLEEMYAKRVPAEQVALHMQFAMQNLPISKICRTELDLVAEIERLDVDAVFAGSDALFKYVPQRCRTYFSKRKLRFENRKVLSVENLEGNAFWGQFVGRLSRQIPAVAFSVSSQNCPYQKLSKLEQNNLKTAISHYTQISTRDEWTRKMVQKITGGNDVFISPDPVFSFNENVYVDTPSKKEILTKFDLPENYVLLSFRTKNLSDEYINSLAECLERKGFTPVAFPMPEGLKKYEIKRTISLPLSPLLWYALIKYSYGYIGERMHPIVVSLHNANPFFCFDEYGIYKKYFWGLRKKFLLESSKTFHILKLAGLESYLGSYFDKSFGIPEPQDVVEKLLHFPREKCAAFSRKYQTMYEESMKKILSSFLGNGEFKNEL